MKFLVYLILIVILAVVGYLSFYYLEGFDVVTVFNQSTHPIQIPDQSQFNQDPSYASIQDFLSRRWNIDPSGLKVMVSKSLNPNDLNSTDKEIEVLDTSTLNSAYLVLINSSGGADQYQKMALDKHGNLFLISEFLPQTPEQQRTAQIFYEESDALIAKTMDYPVIQNVDISDSGDGTITARGQSAQYRFPIKFGIIFKRLGSFVSF